MAVEVKGFDELIEGLNESLEPKEVSNVILSYFRKIAAPITKGAKNELKPHKRTGNLYKSIGTKTIGKFDNKSIAIGARTFGKWKGYHGWIYENGTELRTRRSGGSTGKQQGSNFFQKTIDKYAKVSAEEMALRLNEAFHKFVERKTKNARKKNLK